MSNYDRMHALAALALLALSASSAGAPLAENAPVTPEAFIYCTTCHGMQLGGNRNIEAPRLSGLPAWYVAQQLTAFRNGWRGTHEGDTIGMEMRPMAEALDTLQVPEAARYAAATVSARPAATLDGDRASGRAQFANCAACHGIDAAGNEALGAPPLSGLDDWYLARQLEHFRDGVRGSAPGDEYGAQMRATAALLADEQAIRDVVAYITSLTTD